MNTVFKTPPDELTPFQTGKTIEPDNNAPYLLAKKRNDLSFIDMLLIPLIEKYLSQSTEWKDRVGFIPDQAKFLAADLRGVHKSLLRENGSSNDRDHVKEMRYRFPNELNVIMQATALRNQGKTDAEILEILKADGDLA